MRGQDIGIIMLAAMLWSAGCSAKQTSAPTEHLIVKLPVTGGWYEERRSTTATGDTAVFYPGGDDRNNWSQRLVVSSVFGAQQTMPVLQAMELGKRRHEQECAGLVWHLLKDAPDDVTYEWWRDRGCPGRVPAHGIGRWVAGAEAMHHVAYSTQQQSLPAAQREMWLRTIESAELATESVPAAKIP